MDSDLDNIKQLLDGKDGEKRKGTRKKPVPVKKEDGAYYLDSIEVEVARTNEGAVLPSYSRPGDSCMDLRADNIVSVRDANGKEIEEPGDFEKVFLLKGHIAMFGTGIKVGLPKGWSADVMIRSGLSSKEGLVLMNGKGEVDTTYKGEIVVAVGKINNRPTVIRKGDRIAQFKPVRQTMMTLREVKELSMDDNNTRGEAGFGSSGKQ